MNKDTITGFVLIALVLVVFTWFNQPSAEQQEAQRKQDSISAVQKEIAQKAQQLAEEQKAKPVVDSAAVDTTALFYQSLKGTSEQVVLKNDKLELTLDTKGGTLTKATLVPQVDGTLRLRSKDTLTAKGLQQLSTHDGIYEYEVAVKAGQPLTLTH